MVEPVWKLCNLRSARWSSLALGSIVLGAILAVGCARPAEPCLLGLAEGDLVLTEIRGPQDRTEMADTRGEWLEIWNATDEQLDLLGLRITLVNFKGTQQLSVMVRASLPVDPGGYVVLGSLADPPDEVDYSFNEDFQVAGPAEVDTDGVYVEDVLDVDPRELFSNARVELVACQQVIDTVIYDRLPALGTYSLSGAPDAERNDDPKRWCTDSTPAPTEGPQLEQGLPGSPGEANRPCP